MHKDLKARKKLLQFFDMVLFGNQGCDKNWQVLFCVLSKVNLEVSLHRNNCLCMSSLSTETTQQATLKNALFALHQYGGLTHNTCFKTLIEFLTMDYRSTNTKDSAMSITKK